MSAVVRCSGILFRQQQGLLFRAQLARSSSSSALKDKPENDERSKKNERRIKRRNYRFIFPEFLPDPDPSFRNKLREKLERKDMIRRREVVEIPEFYVGSIIAVETSDDHTPEKKSRFLGIVIDRGGSGLRAWTIVRNAIDDQGVEVYYELYSPTVIRVEIIKLEMRLDDELYYLRDADLKYSTFPQDMEPTILPDGIPVPVNDIVVPLGPYKWRKNWDKYVTRLKGFTFDMEEQPPHVQKRSKYFFSKFNMGWTMEYDKYDLLRHYKHTVPVGEQDEIWEEVGDDLERRDQAMKKVAAKKAFVRPKKIK